MEKGSIMEPYTEVLLSWNVVEKRIRKLIEEDRYLSPEGKEAYAVYKEDEARKAIQKAQEKLERYTKVCCKEAIEKAIAEKFDGYRLPKETAEDVIREYGSERVAYVLANTVMHFSHDGRFSPDNKEWAKKIEPYAMIENRDLIVTSHPAVLNGFINQTRRYIEHEKELAAQAAEENTVTIDGQNCIQVDEWKSGVDTYLLGNATEDSGFYYAEVNGDTHIEYDHKPDRAEIEEDYLNIMAERNIDRHEAEVFARFEGSDDNSEQPLEAEVVQDTSGQDVQKSEPQIDRSNAVNFRITDDSLGIGGAKEKFRRNVEAIHTLEQIESESRFATPEEQKILSQYVGWGGLADAFGESKSAWAVEYRELKELLSDAGYASARESTLSGAVRKSKKRTGSLFAWFHAENGSRNQRAGQTYRITSSGCTVASF